MGEVCQDRLVLAALDVVAVGLGLGAGGLTATLVAFGLGAGLALAGVEGGEDVGLVVGILTGMAAAGWVSGRMAPHSERFHGAVTGLVLAGLLVVVARLGGSPAAPMAVAWLAVIAAVVAGGFGWWAGKRKRKRSYNR